MSPSDRSIKLWPWEGSSVLCGGLGGAKRCTPQHLNCIVETELHFKDGEKSDGVWGPALTAVGEKGRPAQSEHR